MVNIVHVKDSFYDKSDDVLYVAYVSNTAYVDVEFEPNSFTYYFSTRDQKFLKQLQADEKTIFYRKIMTKYNYKAEESSFSISNQKIEIKLKKLQPTRWTSVEAYSQSPGVADTKLDNCAEDSSLTLTAKKCENATLEETNKSGKSSNEKVETAQMPASKPMCFVGPVISASSNIGFTGLDNLGNTCFMNAVIQVLVNSTPLRKYFLNGAYQADLNFDNPLGCGGKLAAQFASLVKILWSGDRDSFSPTKLKCLIAMKASQFCGFAQHDAQEFLAFLLDGLHEDLNRVKQKPYIEQQCLDNLTDEEAAEITWKNYKARNDSFIVDEFQGQFRSKLVCPVCKKISMTFDPFMYMSVPLPKKKLQFTVFFFRKDPTHKPLKFMLSLKHNSSVLDVKKELCHRTGVPASQLILLKPDGHRIKDIFEDRHIFKESDSFYVFEIESSASDEICLIYCVQRVFTSTEQIKTCSNCCQQPETKLRRCTNCYTVGYCNRSCQQSDWIRHKQNCTKKFIGKPFLVSLPTNKLTYSNLAEMVEAYARYSVAILKPPRDSTLHVGSGDGDNDCFNRKRSEHPVESIYPFKLQPVSKCGFWLQETYGGKCLTVDNGAKLLELPNPSFLAVDWNNLKKMEPFILIEDKDLEHEKVSTTSTQPCQDSEENTLEKCLGLFTEPETLAAEEAWYCPTCKEHRAATKQMCLWTVPDTLIIQLKRFWNPNFLHRDKISKLITYPISGLDLTDFCQGPSLNSPPIYDLYGVVNHIGSLLGGHYTAYARCLDDNDTQHVVLDWRHMDDSSVTLVYNEQSVVSSGAYLLFYKRRNTTVLNRTLSNNVETNSSTEDEFDTADEELSDIHATNPNQSHYFGSPNRLLRNDITLLDKDEDGLSASDLPMPCPACDDNDDEDDNRTLHRSPLPLEIDENYEHHHSQNSELGYTDMDDID